MTIQIIVRQFKPDGPIELYSSTEQKWQVHAGGGEDKIKKAIAQKARDFILKNSIKNRDANIELDGLGYDDYHCAARYEPNKGLVCIISSKELTPKARHIMIDNLFDKDNPIANIAENKKYQTHLVDGRFEQVKIDMQNTLDKLKTIKSKITSFNDTIEDINEKAEAVANAARLFRLGSQELTIGEPPEEELSDMGYLAVDEDEEGSRQTLSTYI
jgi:hypothetical protein